MTVLFGMGPTGPSLEELKQAHHLASDKGPCLVERALLIEVLRKEHDRRDRHVEDSGIALDDVQRGRLQAAFDFRQIRRRNLQPLSRLLLLEVVIDSDQAKSFTQHCISFQEAIQGANYWRKTLMMERAMWSSCTTTRPKATTVFKVDGRIRRFAQCCRRTVFVRARFSFRPSFRMASSSANPHTMQVRRRGFGGWGRSTLTLNTKPDTGPSGGRPRRRSLPRPAPQRSEEHTSNLPSLMRISYAFFCLKTKTTK